MSKITIELDDAHSARFSELQKLTGLNADELVLEALTILSNALHSDAVQPLTPAQEQAIRDGLAAIERGETISQEQVFADLQRKYGA